MVQKKKDKLNPDERRENALRPNPHLGYDRDELGMYLVSRGAYRIAETQFRRAVWLNPFEPAFKEHLAWCLYKLRRYVDAYDCLNMVPGNPENLYLMELIEKNLAIQNQRRKIN
jgi:tetratricopeptide (TPR) repeat protein